MLNGVKDVRRDQVVQLSVLLCLLEVQDVVGDLVHFEWLMEFFLRLFTEVF